MSKLLILLCVFALVTACSPVVMAAEADFVIAQGDCLEISGYRVCNKLEDVRLKHGTVVIIWDAPLYGDVEVGAIDLKIDGQKRELRGFIFRFEEAGDLSVWLVDPPPTMAPPQPPTPFPFPDFPTNETKA